MSGGRYLELLAVRSRAVGNCLCLGLDPDPGNFPRGFAPDVGGLEAFVQLVLDAALPHAAAVKANLAFFEAFGSAGMGVLERLRARVPADVPFIADAKRADIGSTAARQATAIFDVLGADAVTLNPYLGRDALDPFLARRDGFAYVLCRTSNPGAAEVQNLEVAGVPLYLHVAQRVAEWSAAGDPLGLVVGATAADELARVRAAVPALPFLVPGAGTQGGDVAAVREHGRAMTGAAAAQAGGGLLVNVSRAIAGTARAAADPAEAVSEAAQTWAALLEC